MTDLDQDIAATFAPEPATVTATFTGDDLARVGALVHTLGTSAAVSHTDLDALLIAVNEIATNAVRYAGGTGSLTVACRPDGLLVEISDAGPGLPDSAPAAPPMDASHGRGLWLARLLSREFELLSTTGGVTVRVFTPTAP